MKKLLHKLLGILKSSTVKIKINQLDWLMGPILYIFGLFFYPIRESGIPLSLFSILNNFFDLNFRSLGEGMTRGISAFARLNFIESFEYHWLAPVFMIYLFLLTFKRLILNK